MTTDKLVEEFDRIVKVPGLSTSGYRRSATHRHARDRHQESRGYQGRRHDLKEIDRLATRIEEAVKTVPGVTSALANGLRAGATSMSTSTAWRRPLRSEHRGRPIDCFLGHRGETVGEVVDGLAFPINIRYPRDDRDSIDALRGFCPL
jgi:Cu(I)/Ag(I) efflux system membrane protein CusA/SilA